MLNRPCPGCGTTQLREHLLCAGCVIREEDADAAALNQDRCEVCGLVFCRGDSTCRPRDPDHEHLREVTS